MFLPLVFLVFIFSFIRAVSIQFILKMCQHNIHGSYIHGYLYPRQTCKRCSCPRGASAPIEGVLIYTVSQKNRTPATFCNNSNSPGSIAIDFDKKIFVRESALNSMCYFARNFKNRVPAEVFLWHQQ